MKTLAVSSVSFGASNINSNNRHENKPEKNEPTVTIPRSKYDELRRYAAKGVMAVAMATTVLGTGTSVTSCSKSEDVPEVNTQTDKIDLQGQAILMNMLQIVGVPITTNSSNPKYVNAFSVSKLISDFVGDNNVLKGDWTYNDQLSTKDKSVYNSTGSKQLVVTKEDNNNKDYQLKGVLTQSGQDPITIELGKNNPESTHGDDNGGLQAHKQTSEGDFWGTITQSNKGAGWIYCDTADMIGDLQVRAMAK